MSNDNTPSRNNIRNTWIVARSMGGELAPVTVQEAGLEFDRWLLEYSTSIAEAARAHALSDVERSFDHAYDARETRQVAPELGAFWYAEGYRHRDAQVRNVLRMEQE